MNKCATATLFDSAIVKRWKCSQKDRPPLFFEVGLLGSAMGFDIFRDADEWYCAREQLCAIQRKLA